MSCAGGGDCEGTRMGMGGGNRMFSGRTFNALCQTFTFTHANQNVSAEMRMKLTGLTTTVMYQKYTHHEINNLRAAIEKFLHLTQNEKAKI